VPVFFVISVVIFVLIHSAPGDPAAALLGMEASAADIAALNTKMGFDRPLVEQYLIWVKGVLRGDLGYSIFMKQPVTQAIIEHLAPTLILALFAQLIALAVAVPAGMFAAWKHNTVMDGILSALSLAGVAVPGFLLGLFLMLLFGVTLRILPVAGYVSLEDGLWPHIQHLIMPALSLGAVQAALIMRMTRASMLDVARLAYVKTARAKGLKEGVILLKHIFRNASLPILTACAQSFGTLITGAVVTESLFNIPGLGQLILNAIKRRDFIVIQGVVLFTALLYALVNLGTDLLYGALDPRVRLERNDS
jgi:peptide/nickel transport system permease protein